MALSIRATLFLLLVLAVFLTVPVLIGVYVYRDARRRGMNMVLWTLIAVFAPALIGFIIYLLIRRNYPDLECPQCGSPVTEPYVICPQCGARLRPACPNCARPVEPDWIVCPWCATSLDGLEMHTVPPRQRKDRPLNKILVAVIVAPVVLIALTLFASSVLQFAAGPCTMDVVTFAEYNQGQTSEEARDAVHQWLDSLDSRLDRAYALRYDYTNELDSGYECFYLVYLPAGGGYNNSFGILHDLSGTSLVLRTESTGNSGILYCMKTWTEKPINPRVILDGKRIRCEVTVVDYNPTLYFIEPNYATAEPESVALPERLSVVKIVGNSNVGAAEITGSKEVAASENAGVVEITDKDLMLQILSAIDSGERVPMEEIPDYDFRDGFEIVVEYETHDDLISHPDMARHLVFMHDGTCWLNDDRVTNSAHGSSFRMMDEGFYELLEDLFQ